MWKPLPLITALGLAVAVVPPASAQVMSTGTPLVFQEVTPCALFDTRPSQGGTGALAAGEVRTFHVVGSTSDFAGQGGVAGGCGIPGFTGGSPRVEMVYLNLVAVDPAGGGNLKAWATDDVEPAGGVVNYQKLTPNFNNSNAVVVGVRQDAEGNDITVKANVAATHVRGVALGYLAPAASQLWSLGGNSGTDEAAHFLGTTDDKPLNLRVNGVRAFRLEPRSGSPNVIGGFSGNAVTGTAMGATIGGGGGSSLENQVTDDYGTVGGGADNQAGNDAGTTSDRAFDTVGGGTGNIAAGGLSTVAGGSANTASGLAGTVGGGTSNLSSGSRSAVGGGNANVASGTTSTVGGGFVNVASGTSATVPGGSANVAAGSTSFAAGFRAKANHAGSFVWSDNGSEEVASPGANTFTVRASGGIWLGTTSSPELPDGTFLNTSTGAFLSGAGVWTDASSRTVKENFSAIDPGEVLEDVASLPVTSWSYKAEPGVVHIGPVAEDFHATFGVGRDPGHLAPLDTGGVALAAIQGLHRRVEAQDARIAELRGRPSAGLGSSSAPLWALVAGAAMVGFALGRRRPRFAELTGGAVTGSR